MLSAALQGLMCHKLTKKVRKLFYLKKKIEFKYPVLG